MNNHEISYFFFTRYSCIFITIFIQLKLIVLNKYKIIIVRPAKQLNNFIFIETDSVDV